jgi:hypothetical protein
LTSYCSQQAVYAKASPDRVRRSFSVDGEMTERFMVLVLKTSVALRLPGVRIPLSPFKNHMRKTLRHDFIKEDLEEALRTISSIIHKIEKAKEHFTQGTSQWTLAKNRLKALKIASVLITKSLGEGGRFSNF